MADLSDPVVERILEETKPGEDEHKIRVKRYDRAYEVYRAVAPKGDAWKSRVRVPFAMQILDTALVNMAQGKPRCIVESRTPDWMTNERLFQRVFDLYTDRDHLAEKEPLVIQQGLIYGATGGKTSYLYAKPGQPYTGPSFEPWDTYDMWWDPNGRDVDTCAYVVLRSWLSKDDLRKQACTIPGPHDRGQCDGVYHNVDEAIRSGVTARTTKSAQERLLGGTDNLRKDRYEVWEIWKDTRVTTICNKQVLLRDEPNPHQHGKKPVVIANTRPDGFKVQGIPETELVDHIQQALWTNHNLRIENEHLTVWRGFTYRAGGVVDPDALQIKPRALIPVTDHDDLRPIDVQGLPAEAYREEESLLSLGQMVTGISPYVSGAQSVGVDQNTATGVSLLTGQASKLLTFKASRIRNLIWNRVFDQWGSCIQQYMDEPLWVKINGPGAATDWQQVFPEHTEGEYLFNLEASEDAGSKQQTRADAIALLNALVPFVQLGVVNAKVLIEKVALAFGVEDPETLYQQPPEQQAAPFGQNGQQPPGPQEGPGQSTPGMGQQTQLDPRMMQQMAAARGFQG